MKAGGEHRARSGVAARGDSSVLGPLLNRRISHPYGEDFGGF